MSFKSKVKGRDLKPQSREIVSNVYRFMTEEAKYGPIIPLSNVRSRVSLATGVSVRTVTRINNERKKMDQGQCSKFSSPRKNAKNTRPRTDIHDFDRGVLKRIILNMHAVDKVCPTLKTILQIFHEATGYDGCKESLRKIIKTLGFRSRKTNTNRRILVEKFEIQKLRVDYLKAVRNYREEGRRIIFMDGSSIHVPHFQDNPDGLKKPVVQGQRLIIVHAAGEDGFIPQACLIFKAGPKTGDHHSDMTFENYTKWLQEKLIPNLPPRSVVVLDNAPYHNVQVDKAPTTNSTKQEMMDWLRAKSVPVNEQMLKSDLYELVLLYKPKIKTFKIDQILLKHNHNVLRLPSHHPDLNPLELVWTTLKQYVEIKNVTFNLDDIKKLCEEFFVNFSPSKWQIRCDHAKTCEISYLEREGSVEKNSERYLINLESDSESETSNSESEFSGVDTL